MYLMLSTFCDDSSEVIKRKEKKGVNVEVVKPSVVCEYNKYMGDMGE